MSIALPWLIFFRRRKWLQQLNENFDVAALSTRPFSGLFLHGYGRNLAHPPYPTFCLSVVTFGGSRHQSPLSGLLRNLFCCSPDTTVMPIASIVRHVGNKPFQTCLCDYRPFYAGSRNMLRRGITFDIGEISLRMECVAVLYRPTHSRS